MSLLSTALRMMSAIVPGSQSTESTVEANNPVDRFKLQEDLLSAAKACHVRFGGRMELATETDQCVYKLCYAFESIFRHGLRSKSVDKLNSALRHVSDLVTGSSSKTDLAFWPAIKEQLTWHEQERFSVLRNIHSDYGRGRAWLRAALNERSLERHLQSIINSNLSPFYEDWAFILDQERSSVLPTVAAGLGTIVFAIRVDNEELDDRQIDRCRASQSEPIISSGEPATRERVRRKVPMHIISFDNDEEERGVIDSASKSISAPPTCLNSPLGVPEVPAVLAEASAPSSNFLDPEQELQVNKADVPEPDVAWGPNESPEEERVLTPLTDGSMGGLVPVSPLDQTLEDMLVTLPNYLDTELTENAVEATEPLGLDSHIDASELDTEALRVRLIAMGEVLEQAKEDAVTSRLQLARFQRQHQNYLERHEVQLQALNRENELLRQQLRKYVTAVQMLRRDSDATVGDDEQARDYHYEAEQYQEKLVQVAEMHAELMEFNARLTMQLTNRDNLVKRLQAELECLRGPLNEEDMSLDQPCFINIWIPSAFLTGQASDVHHVYQIYVRIRDIEWNIYRRYAQFYALYRELKKHDAVVTTFEFPPKKTLGNKDAKFVEERRQKLQQWLRRVVGRLAQCSPAFTIRPTRQTLVSLMPFFGDQTNNEERKSRNNLSSSPQYMGL
ncbi:Similar to SNX29: Sorting nexin-29 (Bos taurus) [Cotesia congregata]|uniref:Similar to SNX29: Sorting nexin-29 (Bos taurus) n=1 Tax=Cotesia congregata TaxID=51543 RepID=A0A8J2HD59_COTCN|nr:Similar to SNX29: Sorting nexin-29 (Bos taurus) [Cotesia congregata]